MEAARLMVASGQQARASDLLSTIREELVQETQNLRRLMSDLRPPLLEERGLVPAVRQLADRFAEGTGLAVHVLAPVERPAPRDQETIAFRIVQEALSNVRKHADASAVTIRIETVGEALRVEIADDGGGFDVSASREFLRAGKVGLASMRERTELGSGTFVVRSAPGQGSSVAATLPLVRGVPAISGSA
jgi:signal transduction histidine kinase